MSETNDKPSGIEEIALDAADEVREEAEQTLESIEETVESAVEQIEESDTWKTLLLDKLNSLESKLSSLEQSMREKLEEQMGGLEAEAEAVLENPSSTPEPIAPPPRRHPIEKRKNKPYWARVLGL